MVHSRLIMRGGRPVEFLVKTKDTIARPSH